MRFSGLVLMLISLCGGAACRATRTTGPSCPDDAREDDDTLEQGLAVTPVHHVFNQGPLRLEGVACPGDADWIHSHADCCNPAGAVVRWDASRGPLEVELLDDKGAPLPLSAPGDILQRQPGGVHLLRAEHGGPFLVRVRAGGETAVPYSVELSAPVFVR
ncbi:hypothetical protein JQX13_52370 [Archangium violaceum]|uniref:hypothetical protein n=1 Tax=Archangium violaceum TaxID=83451 RepID=UPI00193B2865|nr:hypothetical protein [Archangium violaceum]QRK08420.1 hypothetical protein JQX13_52370 [Archangium violaceum]